MDAGSDALVFTIERELPFPLTTVFAAFSAADQVAQWWGPAGFTIPNIDFAPRAGAHYRIEMQPPEGEAFYLGGNFRTVAPPHRLAFTFEWEPANPDDVVTVADLSFAERGESTQVTLTQGPFKTRERVDLHHDGWTETFDKLERFLAGRAKA